MSDFDLPVIGAALAASATGCHMLAGWIGLVFRGRRAALPGLSPWRSRPA